MPEYSRPHRRDFLKTAAVGAAGAMGLSSMKFERVFAQSTGGGAWVNGMQINPAIDNKLVVCCHDTKMLNSTPATGFAAMNAAVNATQVSSNMDEMAMQLARKTTADDAWRTIFRTGASKTWATTKVAIKTNAIGLDTTNRPRVAIIKKICDVLVAFGVLPTNIILYDACDDPSKWYTSTYVSTTDATKIRAVVSTRASSLGNLTAVTLANFDPKEGTPACPADLLNGAVDILVNIAVCKMHDGTGGKYSYGACTLCMKNHFGTFTDSSKAQHSDGLHATYTGSASGGKSPDALFEINKHSAVLGGNPVRQQLCIVDALLSNGTKGPGSAFDNRTDRIVMGTLAPMVDYLTATKILFNSAVMTAPVPAAGLASGAIIVPQYLTSFGYTTTDPNWLEYEAASPPPITPGTGGSGGSSGAGGSTGSSGTGGTTSSSGKGGSTSAGGSSAKGGSTVSNGGSTVSNGGSTVSNGGSTASNGGSTASNGGTIEIGGDTGGGTTAAGGTTRNGGTTSNGGSTEAAGAVATSAPSQTGGSPATGGTTTQSSTGSSHVGGSTGTVASSSSASVDAKSGAGGCDVAGSGRKATRWGAMLTLGTVLATKLRRLVGDDDRSS